MTNGGMHVCIYTLMHTQAHTQIDNKIPVLVCYKVDFSVLIQNVHNVCVSVLRMYKFNLSYAEECPQTISTELYCFRFVLDITHHRV